MTLGILHWVSRCFLAGVLLFSGYTKVQATLQFAVQISGYQLAPESLVLPLATWLPWVEIALGAVLLTGWRIQFVSIGAAGLLSFFIVVQAITYFRGIEADCGCFGVGDKISPWTMGRDVLFLVPAFFLAAESQIRRRWAVSVPQNPASVQDPG